MSAIVIARRRLWRSCGSGCAAAWANPLELLLVPILVFGALVALMLGATSTA